MDPIVSIYRTAGAPCIADVDSAYGHNQALSRRVAAARGQAYFALQIVAASLLVAFGSSAYALPAGGAVSAGGATIVGGPGNLTISQSSQNVAINWQSFSIGQGEAVTFVQPNASSVALNRVLGSDPSSILGNLTANGRVFLLNPNGILFGSGSQVNVGGLVASTLNISDADFMAGRYQFTGTGTGTVVNQGSINADGGYVALLGANVSNQGTISARLGTVALAAGNAVTLDLAGDGLLNVTINQGVAAAMVQNAGLIRADGGQVLLTAQAAGSLLQGVVNNTGIIQAHTIENLNGSIKLLGDMQTGAVNVGGTLDASAPRGGNGGFIETSARTVNIANDAKVTTAASAGVTGTWLIDPIDFNIQALGGDITGPALTALLVNNNVTISTVTTGTNTATTFFAAPGQGDINVNDAVGVANSWTAAGAPTTLTLNSARDVNVNQAITATKGNLIICCGRDINVRAAITTTNGSVLLSAGHDVTLFAGSAMTTTNGNIEMCAGTDIVVSSKITLTNSGSIAGQDLGLPLGLTLIAGTGGTGPGAAGGSVYLPAAGDPLRPTVTRSAAPITDVIINYNPISYAAPTDYLPSLILVGAVTVFEHMLVFPGGADKPFDGTTTASFSSLKGNPAGVTLVTGPGAAATFDTAAVGAGNGISFVGYTLAGPNAANFALPLTCCGALVGRTTAEISATGGATAINEIPTPLVFGPPVLLAGLNLTVVDSGIPPVQLAFTTPPPVIAEAPVTSAMAEAPAVTPREIPAAVVAPVRRPRKAARN